MAHVLVGWEVRGGVLPPSEEERLPETPLVGVSSVLYISLRRLPRRPTLNCHARLLFSSSGVSFLARCEAEFR